MKTKLLPFLQPCSIVKILQLLFHIIRKIFLFLQFIKECAMPGNGETIKFYFTYYFRQRLSRRRFFKFHCPATSFTWKMCSLKFIIYFVMIKHKKPICLLGYTSSFRNSSRFFKLFC